MHPSFHHLDHRPWPVPTTRWSWRQEWADLLFAHWPVPAAELEPLVPAPLRIQQFEGTSWVGVVPFRMQGVTRRELPAMPWLSAFPELNLRLYVEHGGRPGVWFLSLDAARGPAVWAARRFFHLPYYHARMRCQATGDGGIVYRSTRRSAPAGLAFEATYRPTSEVYEAVAGTLEHQLTERYCLYAQHPSGRLLRAEVHHRPWPLQKAVAEISVNQLTEPHGFRLEGPPALLHFARHLEVAVWNPEPVDDAPSDHPPAS